MLVWYRYKPLMFSTAVVDDEAIWDIQIQTSKKKQKKKSAEVPVFHRYLNFIEKPRLPFS